MALSPIPGPAFRSRTFSNIQPFTYEDGLTVAEVISRWLAWFRENVMPVLNEGIPGELERLEDLITSLTDDLQDQIDSNDVDIIGINARIDDLEVLVQSIIDNSIEAQDTVVAALVRDALSETRGALRQRQADDYNEYTIDMFSGATDTIKLQAAIDAATAAEEDRVIVVPRAMVIDETIRWDIGYSSLRFGRGVVESTVVDAPTFTVHNTRGGLTGNTNKFLDTMVLRGPGRGSDSIAFEFHSPDSDYAGNARGLTVRNVEVRGFGVIYQIQANAYLLTFENSHVWQYDIGCNMPWGFNNYGEKITFIASNFGTGGTAIVNGNANGDIYMIGGSVDFAEKLAEAKDGIINFESCHIELRHSDVTGPIATTHASRAQVSVRGGRLMFHAGRLQADHLFHTEGTPWGMGIVLDGVETFNAGCKTNILCGGTGNLKTSNIQTSSSNGSGSTSDSVIPSYAQNRLIDPTFGSGRGRDYANVVDAFVDHSSATSRTETPDMKLTQTAPGRLIVTKKATNGYGTTMRVIVPLTGDLSREWAAGFTITNAPTDGSFSFYEGFWNVSGYDSRGIPQVARAEVRSTSIIKLVDRPAPFTINYGYTAFDRHERPWATHFMVFFNIRSIGSASESVSMNFSDIVLACR